MADSTHSSPRILSMQGEEGLTFAETLQKRESLAIVREVLAQGITDARDPLCQRQLTEILPQNKSGRDRKFLITNSSSFNNPTFQRHSQGGWSEASDNTLTPTISQVSLLYIFMHLHNYRHKQRFVRCSY